MKKLIIISIIINLAVGFLKASEIIYICTGANSTYFPHLINLIGSIHKNNYDSLKEIMVFDLGLTPSERAEIMKIKKTVVRDIEKTHPDVLNFFQIPGRNVFGWYAWKPGIIHQALQEYPYVLWIDAGTTILKPIDDLMHHIIENGYFLGTGGDEIANGKFLHSIGWGSTSFVREKFKLEEPENQWILEAEMLMGNLNGVSREGYETSHMKDWYEASFDMRNFQDDGTTPDGGWHGRHDQTYLSVLAYTKGLYICKVDYTQEKPALLKINGQDVPFYITWNSNFVYGKTHIYHSRGDIRGYEKYIQYK
jgi:hypothetical protein